MSDDNPPPCDFAFHLQCPKLTSAQLKELRKCKDPEYRIPISRELAEDCPTLAHPLPTALPMRHFSPALSVDHEWDEEWRALVL